MQIIQLDEGEVVVRGQERQEYVWYIVIKGSADLVLCAEPGAQAYVVHAFQEGDTFAHPYIDLYSSGVAGIDGCIRASEPNTSCVRVFVPDGCREDFRAQTKPLWYKVSALACELTAAPGRRLTVAAGAGGLLLPVGGRGGREAGNVHVSLRCFAARRGGG